jgi:hypothetical protein
VLVFGGKGRAGVCTSELAWMTTERMEWHAQARPRSGARHPTRRMWRPDSGTLQHTTADTRSGAALHVLSGARGQEADFSVTGPRQCGRHAERHVRGKLPVVSCRFVCNLVPRAPMISCAHCDAPRLHTLRTAKT